MGEHMGIWEEISPLLQSPHSLLSTWSWLPALKKRTALSYRWNKGPVVIWQHIDATRSQVWSGVSEPRTSKSSILLVIISWSSRAHDGLHSAELKLILKLRTSEEIGDVGTTKSDRSVYLGFQEEQASGDRRRWGVSNGKLSATVLGLLRMVLHFQPVNSLPVVLTP